MKHNSSSMTRFGAAALGLAALAVFPCPTEAGETRRNAPALLSEIPLPPPRENRYSNIDPQPDYASQKATPSAAPAASVASASSVASANQPVSDAPGDAPAGNSRNGGVWPFRRRAAALPENMTPATETAETAGTTGAAETEEAFGRHPSEMPPAVPPTPQAVEAYRIKLENRMLERYNNMPDFAGKVALVQVVLSRPIEISLDGSLIRAEFDQLVYDNWGKRLPALEKEYYAVTFGSGGAARVRSEPSVRIGLDLEKTYSEKTPLAADPFRAVPEADAFRPAKQAKMPDWWRPEFPEEER